MRCLSLIFVLAAATAPMPAQSLLDSLPADTLVYISGTGSYDEWMEGVGAGTIWKNPVDPDMFMAQAQQGFDMLEEMFGIEAGSMMGWLTNIKSFEAALYRLELTDGFPELDFAVVIEHSQAEQIWNVLSGKIAEQIGADITDEGDMEIPVEAMALNVARRGDRIILASDARRLRETAESFGQVKAGSLAQSPSYKFVVGNEQPISVFYGNAGYFMKMLERELPPRMITGYAMAAQLLGLRKLDAVAFCETRSKTRAAIKASGPMPMLQLVSGAAGDAQLLRSMPAETTFGIVYAGGLDHLWKQGAAMILDPEKNPMAPMIEARLVQLQQMLGMKVGEIAAMTKGGVAFGMVPDEHGELDGEENLFMLTRLTDPVEGVAAIGKIAGMAAERLGRELERKDAGGTTVFRLPGKSEWDPTVSIVASGDSVVVGTSDSTIEALRESVAGNRPTLGSTKALAGLPQKAELFMYFGLKSILANEREFAPALGMVQDDAGVAASVRIKDDSVVFETTKPLSQVFGALGVAAAYYQSERAHRKVHLENLRKIGEAYKEFLADRSRPPRSLADLGFSGEKALLGPMVDGVQKRGEELYVLLPPGTGANGHEDILAYCKDTRGGRLVLSREGYAWAWSEARFRKHLSKKMKATTRPTGR